jgi:hypothetical protein
MFLSFYLSCAYKFPGPFVLKTKKEVDQLLDKCNGRWDAGLYQYHARTMEQVDGEGEHLPYVIGCWHGATVARLELQSSNAGSCRASSTGLSLQDEVALQFLTHSSRSKLSYSAPGIPILTTQPHLQVVPVQRVLAKPLAVHDTDTGMTDFWGFPADARMHSPTSDRVIRMDELQIGDTVTTSGLNAFTAASPTVGSIIFISQAERLPDSEGYMYLTLRASSGHNVTIAPSQYLPINGELAAAHTVALGDDLTLADSKRSPITDIKPTRRRSRYAPHVAAADGLLVINGVVVSPWSTGVLPRSWALYAAEAAYHACSAQICRKLLSSAAARRFWTAAASLAPRGEDYLSNWM